MCVYAVAQSLIGLNAYQELRFFLYLWLCLNSGAASFKDCILRLNASQQQDQGCPILKVPSNAAKKYCLLFQILEEPMDESFKAQPISECILHQPAAIMAEVSSQILSFNFSRRTVNMSLY